MLNSNLLEAWFLCFNSEVITLTCLLYRLDFHHSIMCMRRQPEILKVTEGKKQFLHLESSRFISIAVTTTRVKKAGNLLPFFFFFFCPQDLWAKGLMMFAGRKRSCFQNAHSRSPQIRITSCKQNTTSLRHRSLQNSTKNIDLWEQGNNTITHTDCPTVSAILQPSLRSLIYPDWGSGRV